MQFKENPQLRRIAESMVHLFSLIFFFFPVNVFSQTTYLPQGDKANILIERFEILSRKDSFFNFSKTKPLSRHRVIDGVDYYTIAPGVNLSKVDAHNVRSLYMNNLEWVPEADRPNFKSKKPIWKSFYKTPANLFETHVKDFDLIINPVFQYVVSKESNNSQNLFLNTRGLTVRGRIANKIGFAAYITDNQERDPLYVQQFISARKAVPGAGFYKPFKSAGGVDYFDARGYFTFNAAKYIDITFGYDKNFIGNGHRSLFLSDFSNNTLFLKLNTRIWKLNYQNLFMELMAAEPRGSDR